MQHIKTNTKSEALMYNGTQTTIYSTDTNVFLGVGLKKQNEGFKVSKTSTDIILSMDSIRQNMHNTSFTKQIILLDEKKIQITFSQTKTFNCTSPLRLQALAKT
jgi:hypothetical protein